jgi:hypothetical protein
MNIPVENLVWGADTNDTVRVIIKNNTFSKEDGAEWEGILLDTKVEINESSNAINVVASAVKEAGYTISGAESNYITEIGGLSAYDGGYMSGWMGTINDWFTSEGLNAYTVANGTLQAGDEICMWYTCNWGADIASDWSSSSTSLKSIEFSTGTLSTSFDSKTKEYTLVIPDDTEDVIVTPTAENKNFMVKVYKNNYTPTSEGTEYKRSAAIHVTSGDKIIVGIGNSNWPSMNSGQTETVYTFNVKYNSEMVTKPVFQQFNFMTSSFNGWVANETYNPDILEYNLDIKSYNTSSIVIQSTTVYDTDKYLAVAKYIDSTNEERNIEINSGKITTLSNMSFGLNKIEVVIYEKENTSNATTYTFNITRPYDTSIGLNTSSGLVVVPEGRSLLSTLYKDKVEGTIFKLDDSGELSTSGMSATCYAYKAFVLDGLESFSIKLTGKTNYVRLRISEDGENYTEVNSGSCSPVYTFDGDKEKKLYVQTISDKEYLDNGFENVSELGNEYTLTVVSVDADLTGAKIVSAKCDGDMYPIFDKDTYSYGIVIENGAELPDLIFSVAEGAKVFLGTKELTSDENGDYVLTLKTSAQSIKIEAENGIINTYSFKAIKKSKNDVPDKVVDYLCINSQYTNVSFGIEPMTTLSGSLKSLGNFGGYITYYYEDAIIDNPNNMYGVDFYVYGNAFSQGGSAAENGQVWVSEDGEQWYALAGSEHYEDTTLKDYEITYTKTASGKTAWTDNYGGSNDGSSKSGSWVNSSNYYMNDLAKSDTITLKGILLPCEDGSLYGDGTVASYAKSVKFGYVDSNVNGTIGANVNPYDELAKSNGFDLKWAVDEDGNPVTLENGVHYIKIVTASNIWAGAFNEKSTEVTTMVRTTATEESVGTTTSPNSIIVTNENNENIEVKLEQGIIIYDVNLDDSKNVKISVSGADESDNIYINNTRISSSESADIYVGDEGKKVRVIVQNGEKEPVIYILNLVSDSIEKAQNIFEETTDYLLGSDAPVVNSIGGEWKVIGLTRADKISDEFKQSYFKNAYEYVKAAGSAKLHNTKSTDNSRMILALTSLGYDVTDIAGQNLLTPLSDINYVKKQGINGLIWALIAFDSAEYQIPELVTDETNAIKATRENLIQEIENNQLDNGGFTLDGENADIDITAMALQALAPYYSSNELVKSVKVLDIEYAEQLKNVVNNAINYLSEMQNKAGSYGNTGADNCESTAQVVIALASLGINPRTDARFIKGGNSVLTALLSYYKADGEFSHILGADENEMSTEQAYLALVSYNRLLNSNTTIYDMSDVIMEKNPVIEDETDNNDVDSNADSNKSDIDNTKVKDTEDIINTDSVQKADESALNADNVQKANNSKNDTLLPKTGDCNNIILYVLLMASASTGVYIIVRGKKRKYLKEN